MAVLDVMLERGESEAEFQAGTRRSSDPRSWAATLGAAITTSGRPTVAS